MMPRYRKLSPRVWHDEKFVQLTPRQKLLFLYVLTSSQANRIGFIPWFPIASGELAKPGGVVDRAAHATGATPSQVALAWLLHRSPVMLPIPGTSSVKHLEENCAAGNVRLTPEQMRELDAAAPNV